MRSCERSIKISSRGSLYLTKAMSDSWPTGVKHARLGYDEETGLLVLEPAAVDTPGARTVTIGNKNEMRLQFSTALRFFGLLPTESIKLPAQWIHDRIEAILPGKGGKIPIAATGREAPSAKESGPPESPRDLAKASAMEAAIEFEDAVTPATGILMNAKEIQKEFAFTQSYFYALCSKGKFPAHAEKRGKAFLWRRADVEAWALQRTTRRHVQPEEVVAVSPVGQPRCSNCAASLRMHENGGLCGNQASKRFNSHVRPRDVCPEHKPWRPKNRRDREDGIDAE